MICCVIVLRMGGIHPCYPYYIYPIASRPRIGHVPDGLGGIGPLVEDAIDGVERRRMQVDVVGAELLGDDVHTLRAEIALGDHLHLGLGRLDGIAPPDHGAKRVVARKARVARDELVAQIDRVEHVSPDRVEGIEECVHLLHGVGHEHGVEVVAKVERPADAGTDGIDVLQHGRILDADHVARGLGLDVMGAEHAAEGLGPRLVRTAHGQVGEALLGHLLGMGGSADAGQLALGHAKAPVDILREDRVLARHDSLDGRNDKLVAHGHAHLVEQFLRIRRRRDEEQRVVVGDDVVDVRREVYLRDVEGEVAEIARVVSEQLEAVDGNRAPHIPPYFVGVLHYHLGQGRSPTAATYDSYTSVYHRASCS